MRTRFLFAALTILTALFQSQRLLASGYTQNLFLCDMGLMNPDRSNTHGVDYVEYTQNGRRAMLRATPSGTSAANLATQQLLGYDRWNPLFGIDEVSFNLDSEFYGSQYYLEYCYTWDRQFPLDAVQYSILFTSSLPVQIPYTDVATDSKCSIQFKNGGVSNSEYPQTPAVQNLLATDQISMRCTIRLSFKENSGGIRRPHNNDLGAVDPQIKVKVEP